jgi:O-antigen/teichoic acid export membrane protein
VATSPLRVIASASATRIAIIPLGAAAAAATAYLTIGYASSAQYGYINLIATLFLLIPFVDLGLGAPVVNAVADMVKDPVKEAEAVAVLRRVFAILASIGLGGSAVAVAVGVVGWWPAILGLEGDASAHANIAVVATLCLFLFALPMGLGQRVLIGLGRTVSLTVLTGCTPVVTLGITAIGISIGAAPLLLAAAQTLALLLSSVATAVYAASRLGLGWRRLLQPDGNEHPLGLSRSAVPFFIVSVGIPVAMQSGRMVLARTADPAALAEYALAAQMYAPAVSVVTVGAVGLWPHFRSADGGPKRREWRQTVLLLLLIGAGIGLTYMALARWAGELVSGGQIQIGSALAVGFGTLILVIAAQQPPGLLLTDEGGLRFQAYCVIAMVLVTLSLSIALSNEIGASGPAWASVIAVAGCQVLPGMIFGRRVLSTDKVS